MGPEASVFVYQNGQKDYAINIAQLTQKDVSVPYEKLVTNEILSQI